MNKVLSEFKNFAMRGKVIDLAVGFVIGNTFSKVISSVVSDLVMPILSMCLNFTDYKNYEISIGNNGASLAVGSFIDNLINLLLVIIILFLFVKMINRLREGQAINLDGEPSKSEDIALLEEIRDLLKNTKEN